MKKIFYLLIIIFPLLSFAVVEVFFDFEYKTIDGEIKQTGELEGKKVMVILLPVTQADEDLQILKTLDSLSIQDSSRFIMIGVPSIEDGFTEEYSDSLKSWYRSVLHAPFIITEGMYTKKDSPSQHSMFRWLTHMTENMHFDDDANGPGEKFFINEQGELYGVYSSSADLSEQLLNKMAL